MPFANVDGSVIDVYQAPTQLNDEAGQAYPFSLDALLDRALGAGGVLRILRCQCAHATLPCHRSRTRCPAPPPLTMCR